MHFRTLIMTSIALFGAGVSSANSGPCAVEIDGVTKALASKDAGSGPTVGAGGQVQAPTKSRQHPPTAIMGQQTQGKAASPEDVRRQTQGQPTAADQAAGGTSSGPDKTEMAHAALQRARALDAQGKEAECMETVRQAKEIIGAK
jgi:hypothetical protein